MKEITVVHRQRSNDSPATGSLMTEKPTEDTAECPRGCCLSYRSSWSMLFIVCQNLVSAFGTTFVLCSQQ